MARRFVPSRQDPRKESSLEGRSEAAWAAMTAVDADESDRWSMVEEHLLRAEQDVKRWKYFAK